MCKRKPTIEIIIDMQWVLGHESYWICSSRATALDRAKFSAKGNWYEQKCALKSVILWIQTFY